MESAAYAAPPLRAREYETIYILRPNAGDEAGERVSSRILEIFERESGKLIQVEVWGRRRLAYKIKGHPKGIFVHLRYAGRPGLVEEIERNFRMLDAVLKYQTVKLADEVDLDAIEVDPKAVEFAGLEFTEEVEEELAEEPAEEQKEPEAKAADSVLTEVFEEPAAPPPAAAPEAEPEEEQGEATPEKEE